MIDFKPRRDLVVIKREVSALERRTKQSGIHLPDSTKEGTKSSEGVIIAMGPDVDSDISIGQNVLFARYSGDDIKVGDEEYILVSDADVFGEIGEAA